MKTSSNSLYNLIHSLDASEKKHCKLYLKRNTVKKEAKIITLYNLVDKQKEYSEDKILSESVFTNRKQFFNLKKLLYDNLIDALSLYHQDLNSDILIRNFQNKAEILYYKGLVDQVHPMLNKAKQLAYKLDNYVFLRDIINMQKSLWNKQLNTEDEYEALLKELKHITFINNRYDIILTNANKIYAEYKKYGTLEELTKELEALYNNIEKIIQEDGTDSLTNKEKVLINYQYCTYHRLLKNNKLALEYSQKNIDLFEKYTAFKYDNYYNYINTLNIHINLLCEFNKIEKALEYLENFRTRISNYKLPKMNRIKSDVFEFLLINELDIHIESGKHKRALSIVPYYEKFISKNEEKIQETFLPKFLIDIAIIYLANNDYHSSLKWTNKLLNKKYKGVINIINTAKVLTILIHIELHNLELANQFLKSLRSVHSTNKKSIPIHILNVLKNYLLVQSSKKAEKYTKEIMSLLKNNTNKEDYSMYHFNVLDYIGEKINI